MDFSSLKDVAEQADVWSPPTAQDFTGPEAIFTTFDQSLTATGWVSMCRTATQVHVKEGGMIKPTSDQDSFEEDYDRALQIEDAAIEVLRATRPISGGVGFYIVHETPPVLNAFLLKKNGPRAGIPSRMAGQSIRSAAHRFGWDDKVRMVNAQQSKKVVCGNHKADKREAHDALRQMTWIHGLDLALKNEHLRDATLLGLNVMHKEK